MRDPAHQREAIVGLTHTEIMLVLAVVILMLLLAKDFQLKSAHAQIEEQGPTTVTMTLATPKPSPDPGSDDDPVDEPLTLGGVPPHPKLGELGAINGETNHGNNSLTDTSAGTDPDEPVTAPLTLGGDPPQPKPGELGATNGETNYSNNSLTDTFAGPGTDTTKEPDNLFTIEESLELQNENKELREEVEDLREKIKNLKEIGFIPCWPGKGKPRYYFTYKITYYPGTNTFRIEPHPNWKSKNGIVSKAVNGGFPMLKKYPQGKISRAELLSFGITLDKQKRDLYEKECYLAVTINKKGVDGTVIEFLRDSVHFYPIY